MEVGCGSEGGWVRVGVGDGRAVGVRRAVRVRARVQSRSKLVLWIGLGLVLRSASGTKRMHTSDVASCLATCVLCTVGSHSVVPSAVVLSGCL